MNLSDCPVCRVGSVWNTGVCPVCPRPRRLVDSVSGVDWAPDPSERRKRLLDRLWRESQTRGAAVHYRGLMVVLVVLVALAVLLLGGCAQTPMTTAYWTDDVALRGALEASVAEWSSACGYALTVHPGGMAVGFGQPAGDDVIGATTDRIVVARELGDSLTAEVVKHEMGHALGLPHSADGVMAPVVDRTVAIRGVDCR